MVRAGQRQTQVSHLPNRLQSQGRFQVPPFDFAFISLFCLSSLLACTSAVQRTIHTVSELPYAACKALTHCVICRPFSSAIVACESALNSAAEDLHLDSLNLLIRLVVCYISAACHGPGSAVSTKYRQLRQQLHFFCQASFQAVPKL